MPERSGGYNRRVRAKGRSSAGRASVSKTESRRFESCRPCFTERYPFPRRPGILARGSLSLRAVLSKRVSAAAFLLGTVGLALAVSGCGGKSAADKLARHQLEALYVIDHSGLAPKDDSVLEPYGTAFDKIITRCTLDGDALTNRAIQLADQASVVGGRHVSNLAVLERTALLLETVATCTEAFNRAEAYLETGS